jgi:XTP/dITP diphosphohydrolase
MEELIFVTNNPHKLKEIRAMIGDQFHILSLADIGCHEEITEDAPSIEGNASLKSTFIWKKYGKNCFADDTGLEIKALEDRPGVKSARYAGEDCNPDNNIRKILLELKNVKDRRARFRTVISLIMNGNEILFEGIAEGTILHEKRGEEGFGYDPVFLPKGYDQTFAEMDPLGKNRISHRGKAVQNLIGYLRRLA